MKTLLTGGVRSGKSVVAEGIFSPDAAVRYVATGPVADDGEWGIRVAAHQQRRPASWSTLETRDIPVVLAASSEPVLVDCLGNWLTGTLDELGAWEREQRLWINDLDARVDALCQAIETFTGELVLVTNEVGWSVVSEHRSGRVFTDQLGRANAAVAAVCERVLLCVCGIAVAVKGNWL